MKTKTIGGINIEKPATLADMIAPWLVVGVRGANDTTMCEVICYGTREECRTFADKVKNQPDLALLIMPISEWERPDGPFADTASTVPALAQPPSATNADPDNPLAHSKEVESMHTLQIFSAAVKAYQDDGCHGKAATLIAQAFSECDPATLESHLDALKPVFCEAFFDLGKFPLTSWGILSDEVRAEHKRLSRAITIIGHA